MTGNEAKITAATLSSFRFNAIFIMLVLKVVDSCDWMTCLNLLSSAYVLYCNILGNVLCLLKEWLRFDCLHQLFDMFIPLTIPSALYKVREHLLILKHRILNIYCLVDLFDPCYHFLARFFWVYLILNFHLNLAPLTIRGRALLEWFLILWNFVFSTLFALLNFGSDLVI